MELTVDEFKAEIELDRRTIERLMSGKTRSAQYATVKIIADFLSLPPRDLMIHEGDEPGLVDDAAEPAGVHRVTPEVRMKLPITGEHLVGRERELVRLDHAWERRNTTIFCIVAWGGLGKSALVNRWLGMLSKQDWPGAERVFGWTFYSQGVREAPTSADGFIDAALRYFGDPEPNAGTPWDKGQRLATRIRERRTLLVLDGLEPLQAPPGPEEGRLKDPALATLLKALALHNPGLCVITTRIPVADIASWQSTTVETLYLDHLPEASGAELLHTLGILGSPAERRAASREFGGHALALNLLGTYLRDVCGGDIRRRREIALLDDWSEQGGHAWRVMASYERWFGVGPEVAILRLLGLFDRMSREGEVAALRATPQIEALNDRLIDLSESQWRQAVARLRRAQLLAPADPKAPHALDAHPLVREYYRHQLRQREPAAWQAGHERLYQYLQRMVATAYPTTIDEMLPLYEAITHGCLAGYGQEALRLFRHRIRRQEANYSIEYLARIIHAPLAKR